MHCCMVIWVMVRGPGIAALAPSIAQSTYPLTNKASSASRKSCSSAVVLAGSWSAVSKSLRNLGRSAPGSPRLGRRAPPAAGKAERTCPSQPS
jgi:hypothetical protein